MLIPLTIAFGMQTASGGAAGRTSAGWGLHPGLAGDGGGQLSPGAHPELAQGARHVILDGARAHPEPGGDLGIGKAAARQDRRRHARPGSGSTIRTPAAGADPAPGGPSRRPPRCRARHRVPTLPRPARRDARSPVATQPAIRSASPAARENPAPPGRQPPRPAAAGPAGRFLRRSAGRQGSPAFRPAPGGRRP